ncbi:hypothetical protein CkP1_0123 [Citrobacter phage CkP1]|nr:hypothetical protein CkP1_0123 [Citrobacter phage CkP1]
MVPFALNAWEKLPGYPDEILAIHGKQIETSGSFKRNIEMIYIPKKELLGISFYNYSDKGDQVVIPYGTFNIRGCELKASGEIQGSYLVTSWNNYKTSKKIMRSCDTFFIRIYDETDNYSTYVVEND